MFTAAEIRNRVRQQPFVPLRLVTSSGETFDVHHPDLVMVGLREIIVGLPASADPTLHERIVRIAIMHITAMHALPQPASPPGNGQG